MKYDDVCSSNCFGKMKSRYFKTYLMVAQKTLSLTFKVVPELFHILTPKNCLNGIHLAYTAQQAFLKRKVVMS